MKRIAAWLILCILLFTLFPLTACNNLTEEAVSDILEQLETLAETITPAGVGESDTTEPENAASEAVIPDTAVVSKDEYYYDLTNVVLYLETYDCLPENYITKSEAQDLGWSGGSVEVYKEGAAIGGDTFGNREKLLPQGITYTECDLNTNGADSRGPYRLVFGKEDGTYRYFYTADHYSSFSEVYIDENGEVTYR